MNSFATAQENLKYINISTLFGLKLKLRQPFLSIFLQIRYFYWLKFGGYKKTVISLIGEETYSRMQKYGFSNSKVLAYHFGFQPTASMKIAFLRDYYIAAFSTNEKFNLSKRGDKSNKVSFRVVWVFDLDSDKIKNFCCKSRSLPKALFLKQFFGMSLSCGRSPEKFSISRLQLLREGLKFQKMLKGGEYSAYLLENEEIVQEALRPTLYFGRIESIERYCKQKMAQKGISLKIRSVIVNLM
ncbi:hypothetical protein C0584_00465 [Candidatus Parcubacteria bacterium]|nr:MAG: hypothetical protein C0584_00465 [Candidatus Parcubacteria bacterium]